MIGSVAALDPLRHRLTDTRGQNAYSLRDRFSLNPAEREPQVRHILAARMERLACRERQSALCTEGKQSSAIDFRRQTDPDEEPALRLRPVHIQSAELAFQAV